MVSRYLSTCDSGRVTRDSGQNPISVVHDMEGKEIYYQCAKRSLVICEIDLVAMNRFMTMSVKRLKWRLQSKKSLKIPKG